MKKIVFFSILFTYSISFSQVAIGNLNPNPHAQLEVSGEKKGILIPKIRLNDVMLADPFDETEELVPESLLIYNTGPDVDPGYYYWYDDRWNKITVQSDLDTAPTTNILESFENTMTSTVNGVDATAPIINTVTTSLDPATTEGYPLTTTVNGITALAVDIPEPWNLAGGNIKASANTQDIYMNGKVGIGPAPYNNPTAWLDVKGDALINGMPIGRGKGNEYTNTIIGYNAFNNNTTGTVNTALGFRALINNNVGKGNTAVGYDALYYNGGGNYNTAIGYGAGVPSTASGLSNSTTIGYQAQVSNSNTIRLGNNLITRIEGQVGFSASSDRRWKDNIKTLSLGLDFINKIRPVEYIRKNNEEKTKEWGVIAQELQQTIANEGYQGAGVVQDDNTPDHYLSVRYTDLIAPVIKAIQELSKQNQELSKENGDIKNKDHQMLEKINQIEVENNQLKQRMTKLEELIKKTMK